MVVMFYSNNPRQDSLNQASWLAAAEWRAKQAAASAEIARTGPIPDEVIRQLTATKGVVKAPSLGRSDYRLCGHDMTAWRIWAARWRCETAEGRAVSEAEEEAERQRRASKKAKQIKDQQEKDARIAQQEAYRLQPGAAVRVRVPRSKFDGRIGHVQRMYWKVGDVLMADVSVDPVPSDHPYFETPVRYRPIELHPEVMSFRADKLQREHPEMDC